jgi:hypothetical protein
MDPSSRVSSNYPEIWFSLFFSSTLVPICYSMGSVARRRSRLSKCLITRIYQTLYFNILYFSILVKIFLPWIIYILFHATAHFVFAFRIQHFFLRLRYTQVLDKSCKVDNQLFFSRKRRWLRNKLFCPHLFFPRALEFRVRAPSGLPSTCKSTSNYCPAPKFRAYTENKFRLITNISAPPRKENKYFSWGNMREAKMSCRFLTHNRNAESLSNGMVFLVAIIDLGNFGQWKCVELLWISCLRSRIPKRIDLARVIK